MRVKRISWIHGIENSCAFIKSIRETQCFFFYLKIGVCLTVFVNAVKGTIVIKIIQKNCITSKETSSHSFCATRIILIAKGAE